MIKKLLVGLAVLSCTISPQSSFAAENGTAAIYHLGSQAAGNETALSQSGNGLAPIGVKQADEEMEQRYAKREDNQISPQSYVSMLHKSTRKFSLYWHSYMPFLMLLCWLLCH